MEMFLYEQEAVIRNTTSRLAAWIGARGEDVVMVDNATAGMNVVAGSLSLKPADEVLLTDHAYGAVRRIWERACTRAEAHLITASLPFPPESDDQVIDAICRCVTARTRLAVLSHVTSPSALILPIRQLCERLAQLGVAACIDGPHGPAHVPVDVTQLNCDYYTASWHKWACAPLGSGFLYVHPRAQAGIEPPVLSWGRIPPQQPSTWNEEFWWSGTRDLSSQLAVPSAIEFLESVGLEVFRKYTHELAVRGREMVDDVTGYGQPLDADKWHGSMVLAELPPGDAVALRDALHERYRIAAQVVDCSDRRFLRISCHLYNTVDDLEKLSAALRDLLA
jgi:isopenicillin-N epimerase